MRQFIQFSVILLFILSPIIGQKKSENKELFSKTDINYIYNRLLDEVLNNDLLAFIEYYEYYKFYTKNDIVIEINCNKINEIFNFHKATEDIDQFEVISMNAKIKNLPFISPFKIVKKRYKKVDEYFDQGIIHIDFTDIIISKTGEFYVGVEKIEMVPGVYSKEVVLANIYVLKGIICPSGQIILQKVLMQHDAGADLSRTKCT